MGCYEQVEQIVYEKANKLPKGMVVNKKALARCETACEAIDSLSEENIYNDYGVRVCESGDFDVVVMFSSFYLKASCIDEFNIRLINVLKAAKRVEFSTMEDDSALVKVVLENLFMRAYLD